MGNAARLILADSMVLSGVVIALVAATALGVALRHLLAVPEEARLDRLRRDGGRIATGPSAPTRSGESPAARLVRLLSRLVRPSEASEISRVRARLDHAGLRGEHALELYLGSKLLLSLALAGGFFGLTTLSARAIPHATSLTIVLAAIGFYAPSMWLSGRVEERQRLLSRALPDALDLLVVCVEAGLGVEAAIARVVQEIGLRAPLLAREFGQLTLEVRAGVARGEAFRRLAARTGLDELRALAATLVQTELFGTSIARALRMQSEGMRIKRSQRAEERAATVATKMLVPLILCVLPSLFTVILGPAAVRIVRSLLPSLGGQG